MYRNNKLSSPQSAVASVAAMPAKPRVHKITFHLLSPEEIEKNIAVMEVTKKELYDNGNALITNASIAASVVTSDYFGANTGGRRLGGGGGNVSVVTAIASAAAALDSSSSSSVPSSASAAAAVDKTNRILESDAALVKGTSAAPTAPKLSATLMAITKSTNVKNRIEAEGGLLDYRLGSTDRKTPCKTCGLVGGRSGCPGHFGYIRLNFPVFFVGALNTCKNTLKLVCHFCSRLLVDPAVVIASLPGGKGAWEAMSFEERFEALVLLRKPNAICLHRCLADGHNSECDNIMAAMPQPMYTVDKLRVVPVWKATAAYCAKYLASGVPSEPVSNALDLLAEHMARPFVSCDAWTILDRMHPKDLEFMGCTVEDQTYCGHPRNMIMSCILVLSKHLRPTSSFDKGRMRSQNDKTKKYQDILEANEAVAQDLTLATGGMYNRVLPHTACTLPASVMQKLYASSIANLEWQVATLFNNDIKGVKVDRQRSGKPFKSLYQGFKGGKVGRWRQNTVSKRSDFTARNVCSPDPDLDLIECGVPVEQFLKLTVQERVTPFNIEELQRAVHLGPGVMNGASHVKLCDGSAEIDLSHCVDRSAVRLQVDMEVSRCLRAHDVGIINRQPTLYKMSMQAVRLKPVYGNTLRTNLSITPPFNMDHDGDELNLHIPQGVEEQVEAHRLMNVQGNLMSTQSCKMTMYLVQDALVAAWRMSQRSTLLTKTQAITLLGQLKYFRHQAISRLFALPPAVIYPRCLYTGKQVYSAALFPQTLYYDRWRESAPAEGTDPVNDTYDDHVVIRAGRLLCGRLCKRTLGPSNSSAVYAMAREDAEYVTKFLSEAQRIGNYFFVAWNNFSIGPADLVMPLTCRRTIRQIVGAALQQDASIIASTKMLADKRHVEPARQKVLKRLLPRCAEIATSYLQHTGNGCKDVIDCGSKGSSVNIGQMTSCVGQQTVEGTRITSGGRLPCFPVDACDAVSQGLIKHSLLHGLNPHEFFHHAQAGREGLVDTAVKTSDTGYFQRRIARNTENACLENDKSVYNWNGQRMQHVYGGDGWAVNKIVKTTLPFLTNTTSSDSSFLFSSYTDYLQQVPLAPRSRRARSYYEKSVVPILEQQATFVKQEAEHFATVRKNLYYKLSAEPVSEFYAPSDLSSDLAQVLRVSNLPTEAAGLPPPPLDAKSCRAFLNLLYQHIQRIDAQKSNRTRDYYFAASLPIKRLLHLGVTEAQMDQFCRLVLTRFREAQCPPGLSVGMVAAESIGEPTTQLTLNTFHLAGVETTKMVTSGLVRMEELIALQKIIKVTSMTIAFIPGCAEATNAAAAARFAASISMLSVEDVVKYRKVVHDPDLLGIFCTPQPPPPTSSSTLKNQLSDTLSPEDVAALNYFREHQLSLFVQDRDHAQSIVSATGQFAMLLRLDHRKLLNSMKTPSDVAYALRKKLEILNSTLPLHASANNSSSSTPIDPCVVLATPTNLPSSRSNILSNSPRFPQHWYVYLRIPGSNSGLGKSASTSSQKILRVQKNLCFLRARAITENTVFNGVKNITAAFVRQEPSSKEYVVDTYGSNLVEILSRECVDAQRTTTNNLYEIESVFGIEAAAEALFYEYKITMSASNSSINDRHFSLLVDVQCIDGRMKALTRYGINQDHAPLTQIAFEKSVENMYKAALYQKTDNVADVTSNVMLGQNIPVGTGKVGFALLDQTAFEREYSDNNGITTYSSSSVLRSTKNNNNTTTASDNALPPILLLQDGSPSSSSSMELLCVVSSRLPCPDSNELWAISRTRHPHQCTFGDHFYPITAEALERSKQASASVVTGGVPSHQLRVRDAVLLNVQQAYGLILTDQDNNTSRNPPSASLGSTSSTAAAAATTDAPDVANEPNASSPKLFTLPCAMPVDLTREILKNLNPEVKLGFDDDSGDPSVRERYSVREKTDGSRYLLVLCEVDHHPYACLINRRCDVFFVSVCAPRALFYSGSVYDTELVQKRQPPPDPSSPSSSIESVDNTNSIKEGRRSNSSRNENESSNNLIYTLLVMDVICHAGVSYREKTWRQRYETIHQIFNYDVSLVVSATLHNNTEGLKSYLAERAMRNPNNHLMSVPAMYLPPPILFQNPPSSTIPLHKMFLSAKSCYIFSSLHSLLETTNCLASTQLPCDGLIIQDITAPVHKYLDRSIFKWKPACKRTIDVTLLRPHNGPNDTLVPHVRSPSNTLVPLANKCRVEFLLEPTSYLPTSPNPSDVYECSVRFDSSSMNENTQEGKTGGGGAVSPHIMTLQVLRLRDKPHPNTTTSADSVLQCIREDLTLDEILEQSLVGMHELTRIRLSKSADRGSSISCSISTSSIVYRTVNNIKVVMTKPAYRPPSPTFATPCVSDIAKAQKIQREDIISRLKLSRSKQKLAYRPSSPRPSEKSLPPPDIVSIRPDFMCVDIDSRQPQSIHPYK